MKICTKCNIEKDDMEFPKRKDTYRNECKLCWANYLKEYRENNPNKIIKYKEKYKVEYCEKYREKNLQRKEYHKKYREENKDIIKEKLSNYYYDNRETYIRKSRENKQIRRKTDLLFNLTEKYRNLVNHSLKGYKKSAKSVDILGCTYLEFKTYLENQFENWMNWDNYGLYDGNLNMGWDIDHIKPLSSATNEAELIALNHYTNLRPLCSKTNRYIKRNKLI